MKLFIRLVIPILLFSFSAYRADAQLTAGFTATSTAGCAPLVDTFFNTTTPAAGTTYDWDLDNGSGIIHLTNPSGSYLAPGVYTITLTAHNGGSTSTFSMTITVYPSPHVTFTAVPNPVCPGMPVTFTSTTTGGVPGPVITLWDFGDGDTASGNPVTHAYAAAGTYNVTLFATNAEGCQHDTTESIVVVPPPVASFTATRTHFCNPPATDTFINTLSGSAPLTYLWNFGDGSPTSTAANPTHTYAATGSYTVSLIVTNSAGCKDTLTIPNYITISTLTGAFSYPDTACINSMVTFSDISGPHSSAYWIFGDGGSSGSDPTGYHTYSTSGSFIVKLIISDPPCTDTVTHSIIILPAPVASFTITPVHPCPAPATATFAATAPSGCTISWLYGDGYTGTGATALHTYTNNGVFTVKMIVTNASGCKDTVSQAYTIYNLLFGITHPIDTEGCVPLTVNFSTYANTSVPGGTMPYPYGITSYTWNFGDGSALSSSPTPSHTYTAVGTYTVTVSVVTGNGCPDTARIKVLVGKPPEVAITITPYIQCFRDNEVMFKDSVISGPVDSLEWRIVGYPYPYDSFALYRVDTSHTADSMYAHFSTPDTFLVELIPFYNGCPGDTVKDSFIINPPNALFTDSVICSPANTVDFYNQSKGADSVLWMFGDGGTSTLFNPTHVYAGVGTYTVTLTTYNVASGCRDTTKKVIDLSTPAVTFSAPDTAVCRSSPVTLTSVVTGGTVSHYLWQSAGTSSDNTSPTYTVTFGANGHYTIDLIVEDQNGCYDTITRNDYILVAGPSANNTVSPASGCVPLTVTFNDLSTDLAGIAIISYAWSFGDGSTSTITTTSVTHTYTTASTFSATETVTDILGCTASVTKLISAYKPTASFTVSNPHPCLGGGVTFNNTSSSTTTSYWNFGDGSTSTLTSPAHTYADTGHYTVSLIVTDSHGCSDTATYPSYVYVNKPHASFYMDDSISICPPLTVHFTNTSTGGISNSWVLGNGGTSAAVNPSALYLALGYDTVRLIVTDAYACSDTAFGHVNIFGYAGAFSYTPDSGCVPLTVYFHADIINVPTITWDFADGTTSAVSMVDSITHTYLVPGAYVPKLILADNTGCQNSSIGIDTIKVDGVTPGFTTHPNPVCIGDSIVFVDTSSSYWSHITSWIWTYNDTTSTLQSPSVTYTATGTYPVSLHVTDGWGCVANADENVTVYPLPVITVSPDTIVCLGDAATLTAYGGVSYAWSGAGTISCANCNPTHVSPIVVTQYTVTGTDAEGCSNTDTTSVFLKTLTVSHAWGDTAICFGATVPLYDSGGSKYTWIPPTGLNNPGIADPSASPPYTTTYMAIAKLGSCDPDTNYVTVVVHPLPTVDAGPDQNLIAGSIAQLDATGTLIYTYLWSPANTLTCDTCYNPVASMSVTTTYKVLVSTIFGCTNEDTVTIRLYCDNSQLFIPNTFTPNGDGENDVFYPRGTGVSIIKSFRIYNRWGELMFERSGIQLNDASNAWDGTYNGATPRPDVYVWVIDAICETGEPLFLKGDVTIIR